MDAVFTYATMVGSVRLYATTLLAVTDLLPFTPPLTDLLLCRTLVWNHAL